MASSKPVLKNLTTVLEEIGLAVLLIVCAVVIMIVFGAVNDEAVFAIFIIFQNIQKVKFALKPPSLCTVCIDPRSPGTLPME